MLITLPNAIGDAAQNMAIDATLLLNAPAEGALLRHYGWTEPAITFGYTQKYPEVRDAAPEALTLVRRATGGGIVDHRNDWTYALVLGPNLPAARMPATALYTKIHHTLAHALAEQSVETNLAPCPRKCATSSIPSDSDRGPAPTGPSHCFTVPAADDLVRPDGRKIAGAALKRNRHGLLLQGSLDRAALPDTLHYAALQNHFATHLAAALDLTSGEPPDLRPFFPAETIAHERQRFTDEAWNRKR